MLSVRRIEIQAIVLKWICGAGLLGLGLQRHCEQANDEGHEHETMHRRVLSTFARDLENPRSTIAARSQVRTGSTYCSHRPASWAALLPLYRACGPITVMDRHRFSGRLAWRSS